MNELIKTKTIEVKDASDICTECGKPLVRHIIGAQHINGHKYEERTYGCGKILVFIPNFMRWKIHKACPEFDIDLFKYKAAKVRIRKFIYTLDITQSQKDKLAREFN